MNKCTAIVVLTLMATVLLVSCGSSDSQTSGTPSPSGNSPVLAGLPSMPSEAEIARSTSAAATLMLNGASYSDNWDSNLVSVSETQAVFAPNTSNPVLPEDMAFAIYHFNYGSATPEDGVLFDWASAPPAENLWIGFSHWERQAWKWQLASSPDRVAAQDIESYISESGDLLVLIAITGSGEYSLNTVRCEALGQGDWWCFGRDRQNTRCSPFIGPQTSNVKWGFKAENRITAAPVVNLSGNHYFADQEGIVYCCDPTGGFKMD